MIRHLTAREKTFTVSTVIHEEGIIEVDELGVVTTELTDEGQEKLLTVDGFTDNEDIPKPPPVIPDKNEEALKLEAEKKKNVDDEKKVTLEETLEGMEDNDLIEFGIKEAGLPPASRNWKRETRIAKILKKESKGED